MRSKVCLLARPIIALQLCLLAAPSIWGDSLTEALQAHRYADAITLADKQLERTANHPQIFTIAV